MPTKLMLPFIIQSLSKTQNQESITYFKYSYLKQLRPICFYTMYLPAAHNRCNHKH